ncbi:MAG: hypothetical protein RIC87_07995 [Kiloniellales bacterium]
MDIKSLRRECIRMTDRTMPINFRLAAARQIEAYILGRSTQSEADKEEPGTASAGEGGSPPTS